MAKRKPTPEGNEEHPSESMAPSRVKQKKQKKPTPPWEKLTDVGIGKATLDDAAEFNKGLEYLLVQDPELQTLIDPAHEQLAPSMRTSTMRVIVNKMFETQRRVEQADDDKKWLWNSRTIAQLIADNAADAEVAAAIQNMRQEIVNRVGLQRAGFIVNVAEYFAESRNGTLNEAQLEALDNPALMASSLMKVKGVGPVTMQTALIRALQRADVLPFGDKLISDYLGSRVADRKEEEQHDAVVELTNLWAPYRSLAAQLIWHAAKVRAKQEADAKVLGPKPTPRKKKPAASKRAKKKKHDE